MARMGLSTISLLLLCASSAVQSAKPSEICACVPINVCPRANRFSKDDAKYFSTVLKCKEEGFIRCCPHNEITNSVSRRSDDAENIILIDDVQDKFTAELETTTEIFDTTTLDADLLITTESFEEFTTEASKPERQPKAIDNSISVIYPKNSKEEKKKAVNEHLFLIFPNGEVEAAMATEGLALENTSMKPMKRVVVRKRLIKKPSEDSLEGAESKISQAVIEPQQMDIEEVKKRLTDMQRHTRRKINQSSPITTTTSTTENPIEESTAKKLTKKKKRFRKRLQTSTALIPTTRALRVRVEAAESTTKKPVRKIVYNTRGRTNFLKRPSSQQTFEDEEERNEPEVMITTSIETLLTSTEIPQRNSRVSSTTIRSRRPTTLASKPAEFSYEFQPFFTTPTPPKVLLHANRIDFEHKAMIETVHKTLSAIHSGVDMKFVEKMIESHRKRMKESRKHPTPTTVAAENVVPTRPYRGSARFRKPATTPTSSQELKPTAVTGTRTRNLSRTRNTLTTTLTTHKSVRKSPKSLVTQPNPVIDSNNMLLEEVDMPPKLKAPLDFRASPLYGITMDKFNDMDGDEIEKIHDTLKPESSGGFFPVIHNGTPSTLL